MSDRLQEIRARLGSGHSDLAYLTQLLDDVAYLLAEIDRLRRGGHNRCWETGTCECGLWA